MAASVPPRRRGKKKGLGLKLDVQPAIAEDESAVPADIPSTSLASLAAAGEPSRSAGCTCQAVLQGTSCERRARRSTR